MVSIYSSTYDDLHGYTKTHDQANRVSKQARGPQDESELEYQLKLRKSQDRYEELHHAQLAALQKGRDYEVLSTAFRSFSNLEKITFSESFAPPLNYYAVAHVDPTWADSIMQRLRESPFHQCNYNRQVTPQSWRCTSLWTRP